MVHFQSHAAHVASALLSVALLSACAVVETGASVVKATAAVASATVGVAATVVGTTVVAGSAAVSAASTAKSVTVAAVGTAVAATGAAVAATGAAVAAGSLVVVGVQAINNASRENDITMISVVATAPDRFSASDGRKWITRNCPDVAVGQPGLWVATRSGDHEIRVNAGTRCPVLALE